MVCRSDDICRKRMLRVDASKLRLAFGRDNMSRVSLTLDGKLPLVPGSSSRFLSFALSL